MSPITTHILDISRGKPAVGVGVRIEFLDDVKSWQEVGRGITDTDGRVNDLLPLEVTHKAGTYRLFFNTAAYFAEQNVDCFYPQVEITFTVSDASQHYHVPLLLSPFGYSTYRGS